MLKVEVIGNVGADAQVKNEGGKPFVAFTLAHREKWTDDAGTVHEQTQWVDVIINDPESKVVPFIKSGVKLYVRGDARLRVFSSAKDRKMKAGLTVSAREIELCGGSSDDVPSQIIDPNDGTIYGVQKFYWSNVDTKGMKKDDVRPFVDRRGKHYVMNNHGYVFPAPETEETQSEQPVE